MYNIVLNAQELDMIKMALESGIYNAENADERTRWQKLLNQVTAQEDDQEPEE